MKDDGLHGDGTSGDGIYGSTIIISSGRTQYFLYAENSQAGVFSPVRAEQEFYTLLTQASGDGKLSINEFMASNSVTIADQDGEYDDWVEIFNQSDETVSFDSLYLSDSYSNLRKWKFPVGTAIQPKSYLIIWADGDTLQTGLHASFKLSASGEKIALTHMADGILDSITFGAQKLDISMQRCPNDTGVFVFAAPSFGLTNNCPTSIAENPENINLSVYPNPFTERLYISMGNESIRTIRIVDMMGQTVLRREGNFSNTLEINTEHFAKGLYMIILNESISRKIIKK
jgi:hypothetical protein